jgi:hypothetical protein
VSGVLALLPRGEAIRNFVYSGALDTVAEHTELTVASVVPNDAVRELLERRYGAIEELRERQPRWLAGALRDTIDVAHGRWLWSEAAKERWRRRDLEVTGAAGRWKHSTRRAVARCLATPRGLAALDRGYEALAGRIDVDDQARDLLDRVAPDVVFNGSHVHGAEASPIILAARQRDVRTATFVFSWDNLTSQGRVIPRYDDFLVWTDAIRRDLVSMYPLIDPERVWVTGTPQFDNHFNRDLAWSRERYSELVGVDPDRPIVLYSTGMPNHMPGEPWIVEDIADRLASMPERPQLVVRLYAKDRSGRFDELARRRPDIAFPAVAWEPRWLTPLPDDTALWSNMLRHADVGINIASTVSLELCMFDRPVLNVAYNPPSVPRAEIDFARYYRFDHYRPIAESGAIRLISSPDEVRDAVTEALRDPGRLAAVRGALLERFFGDTLDGHAGQRVADVLCELTERAPSRRASR